MTREYPARPIDDYAPTFDVTDTLVITVEHLDLTAPALSVLGGVESMRSPPRCWPPNRTPNASSGWSSDTVGQPRRSTPRPFRPSTP
jgi:hypothetical protein